jgi:hypothetical protein
MQERVKLVYEWIYTNLNPAGKPFALAGSSGGADAVMSPFTRDSAVLRGRIALVAAVSHPIPFYDPKTACQLPTPPGTFIDKATGAAGATGAGPNPPSGAGFLDLLLVNDACSTGTMTAEMSAAAVPTKEALSAIRASGGAGYMGVLHMFVGTAATHDSDVLNGAVYGSGQIFNDPFFAQAVRKWYDGPNESHGDALDVGTAGFARLHDDLASVLLGPQLAAVRDLDRLVNELRLTPKQRRYAEALAADPDHNQTRAAQAAGLGKPYDSTGARMSAAPRWRAIVLACLWGVSGCLFSLAAGAGLFELAELGQHQRHTVRRVSEVIAAMPGVIQSIYVLPLAMWARRTGKTGFALGLLTGAGLVLLLNGAFWVMILLLSRFD